MKKKIFFLIGILLTIVIIMFCYKKTEGTPIEELMQNREWVSKEAKLRKDSIHNWEVSEIGAVKCNHCSKTYKIGQEIDYMPNDNEKRIILSKKLTGYSKNQSITPEEANWVVLGATTDGKGLLITTDEPINEKDNIYLKGIEAYSRGMGILNTVCRNLYSNSEYGFARSMTIEDINNYLGFINPVGQYEENGIYKTAEDLETKLSNIPLYKQGNIESNGSYSPKGIIGPKSLGDYFLDGYIFNISKSEKKDYYNIEILGQDYVCKVQKEKINFIFGEEGKHYSYYLASRGTTLNKDVVIFGMGVVEKGSATNCYKVYDSSGYASGRNNEETNIGIRPVVELYKID